MILISTYLKSRKQKPRFGLEFSDYLNILFGVPQGSILGPILFIIFLSDLLHIYNDLDYASYADGTTHYVCRHNYAEAIEFLEPTINNMFAWFKNNGLVKVIFWLVHMRKLVWKYLVLLLSLVLVKNFYESQLTVNLHFINI